VSWRDDRLRWEDVRGELKNILSLELSKRAGITGRPWFAEGASRKHVTRREHFNCLVDAYLPDHPGWRWDEHFGWTAPRK
jgi:hypothetical protein